MFMWVPWCIRTPWRCLASDRRDSLLENNPEAFRSLAVLARNKSGGAPIQNPDKQSKSPQIPRSSLTPTMDGGDELFPIGCVLSIQTTLDVEPVEGTVIAFDRPSSFLFLRTGRRTCVVNVNFIKDFTYLGREEDPLVVDRSYIYPGGFQDREDASIKQAQVEKDRIGVGVTEEAQSIFDALSKTLPVRWDETVIVVMNEVRVSSPYFSENVSGGTPAANDRVKKVLELVRQKLQVVPRGP